MAVSANTIQTYDNSLIREDLAEQYSMISPEETPFQQAVGTGDAVENTYFEWPIVDLQAPDDDNRVVEGDADVPNDEGTLGNRVGNFTQISDKVVKTSHTSNAVNAAANNIQREAAQIALKLKELKRDIEVMLLSNVVAAPGASGTARATAGLPAWLKTNIKLGVGGAAPALSAGDEGYPNQALVPGDATPLSEDDLNDVIEMAWNAGAEPSMVMVNSNNKRVISNTFTGNSTRYKDAIDKRLVAAIDIYDSDFGELQVVPNRFQPTIDGTYAVYVLDPSFIRIRDLESTRQKPLAETGHSKRRLVWREYGLQVDNEAAHGAIYATNGEAPAE